MTKKDYELIASVINGAMLTASNYGTDEDTTFIQEQVAEAMADALATASPRFDRARFLQACGVEGA